MDNASRQSAWQRNVALEEWLQQTSSWLSPAQAQAEREGATGGPEWPQVFVLGAPRSGTTLLLQWLAASGQFAYPSNLMARFYAAPAIGAQVQRLFTDRDLDFRGELADVAPDPVGYQSALGKTRGALAPNEFWYFWRRFLPTVEIEPLAARIAEVDGPGLRRGIASISAVMQKPFAAKGLMMQYDLEFFGELFPRAVFVHVQRDGASNAASLLRARESFFGSTERWYSAKPPGYEELRGEAPERQVLGQVAWTQRAIEHGLQSLPPERRLTLPYADLCANPEHWHGQLWERVAQAALGTGTPIDGGAPPAYTGPSGFPCTDLAPEALSGAGPYASWRAIWEELMARYPA